MKTPSIEILVATMHRESLDFLSRMFQFNDLQDFFVLVINQTIKGTELHSNDPTIRVINSYEFGLSKSRNLALENAVGDVCLIADDDVVYKPKLLETVVEAYQQHPAASAITFQIETFSGKAYKPYAQHSFKYRSKRALENISSIEISFRRQAVLDSGVHFDPQFGLGSKYPMGEEYLFVSTLFDKGEKIYHVPKQIVQHELNRSTLELEFDMFLRTKAALYRKVYPLAYPLYTLKLLTFHARREDLQWTQIPGKFWALTKRIPTEA